jgi:ankyrin repeat protein
MIIASSAGAGKSVIWYDNLLIVRVRKLMLFASSAVIEDIRILQKSGLASLAFFYCDFRDDQKKGRRELLSSLLVQLGEQSDAYSGILSKLYEAHRRGSQQSHASDSELADCLKDMLKLPGQATVHIVIDALDECPVTTGLVFTRKNVLELVEDLVNSHIPNLRICVTSRPEVDIIDVLENLASCSVSLHGEGGQVQDIAEYVRSFVHTSREMRRWKATDKQLVIDELTNKADGMCVFHATITYLARLHLKYRFRWVVCQLVYLSRCIPGRIRHALKELPTTLGATYARTLEEIDEQNWDFAHRLFQCVAAASRPLRAEELAEFLAFDFDAGSTPTFLADWRSGDPENEVLSICSTLLVVVKPGSGSPVIQFAHFSVKEYLTSARLAETKDTISRFHVSMTPAHTIVAQACLGVLLHLDENITKDSLEDFPLAEYAAEHWVDHARIENVPSKVQDGMEHLFDPSKCHLSVWVWIYDPEDSQHRSEQSEHPPEARATPLHYAAVCNMQDIATFLIVEHSQDVNARGFDEEETPLHVSSRRGHVEIARVLLKHGADTEARDCNDFSPLEQVAYEGHMETAQVLLEHGADVNARDDRRCTPLHWASEAGQLVVAQVLLSHGADVSAQREDNQTPLHRAKDEKVARLLLEHGADANTLDIENRTPLHLASEFGRVGVARVLLEHGVDANPQDKERCTPLYWASCWGKPAVVQILLSHGADVTAQCKNNQTPVHRAKDEEVARLLLEHGADPNALDIKNQTPLHGVSELGYVGAAQVLLEHGVDANARDANNATPLHLASNAEYYNRSRYRDEEYLGVVRLLLHYSSDIHARDDEGQTPFVRATADEYHEIMQLLLEHGAEDHRVMTTDGQGEVV